MSYTRTLTIFVLVILVGAAAAPSLRASGPTFWTTATAADFLKGTSDGVYVNLNGVVTAGPQLTNRLTTTPAQVWSAVETADGTLWAGTGADVALINAGAMRLDDVIPAGPVTNYQLESIFLFADETRVVTFPLSGARLREVLEHGVAEGSLGKGGFLQVSGILFTYDRARPSGSRLVGEITRVGGAALAAGDTVQVVMPAYPACEGGDGYSIPEAAASCAQASAGPRAADLLIRFMSDSLGGKVALPQGGRIVQAASSPG